jgi:hypothetical protein
VAIRSGQVPPAFGQVDHRSAELYQRYGRQPAEAARTLAEAIEASPDLRARAGGDPDLAVLREAGRPGPGDRETP